MDWWIIHCEKAWMRDLLNSLLFCDLLIVQWSSLVEMDEKNFPMCWLVHNSEHPLQRFFWKPPILARCPTPQMVHPNSRQTGLTLWELMPHKAPLILPLWRCVFALTTVLSCLWSSLQAASFSTPQTPLGHPQAPLLLDCWWFCWRWKPCLDQTQ